MPASDQFVFSFYIKKRATPQDEGLYFVLIHHEIGHLESLIHDLLGLIIIEDRDIEGVDRRKTT